MTVVTRPLFAEGQILAAADLAALAAYPRGRDERHNRFVHRWGVVHGLTLEVEDAETSAGTPYKKVFLEPGMAIDAEGREILVTERVSLDKARFALAIGSGAKKDVAYPVFVSSQFRSAQPSGLAPVGACATGNGGSSGGGAMEEGFEYSFGQPGDEDSEVQPGPLSAEATADDAGSPMPVLVGYVTWSEAAKDFADRDAKLAVRKRRFVGLNAGTIAGDGNQILVHPKAALAAGDAVVQVAQDDALGAKFCFGTYKSADEIECLLSVDSAGNVIAKGTLTGTQSGNSVQVQSGLASHGMVLPLPPGVTQTQVATDGGPPVHIQVTPEIDRAASPDPAGDFAALVQECRVDRDRRVHCRICWVSLPMGSGGAAFGDEVHSVPGMVRYTVLVSTSEGNS